MVATDWRQLGNSTINALVLFAELSLTAYSAHKIKNAPDGASFGL